MSDTDFLKALEAKDLETEAATNADHAAFEKARKTLLDEIKANDRLLQEIRFNRMRFFEPTPIQAAFLYASLEYRIMAFLGGNGVGKTLAGAFNTAVHATGSYPEGWDGYHFENPVSWLVASRTAKQTRDVAQRALLGRFGRWGTGMIPKELIVDVIPASNGLRYAVDAVLIKHKRGESEIHFGSYAQGDEAHEGHRYDGIWNDEEPPFDVWTEEMGRMASAAGGRGMIFLTTTPKIGESDVIKQCKENFMVSASLERDCPWLTREQIESQVALYPAWQRPFRVHGIPTAGEGLLFDFPDQDLLVPDGDFWQRLPRIGGMDRADSSSGVVAVALCAFDEARDILYLYDAYKEGGRIRSLHASAIKKRAGHVPIVPPHDANRKSADTGKRCSDAYREEGLNILRKHATFPDGTMSTDAAIDDLYERMATGRFKVLDVPGTAAFFEEKNQLAIQDGKIIGERHLIDGLLKVIMNPRKAQRGGSRMKAVKQKLRKNEGAMEIYQL